MAAPRKTSTKTAAAVDDVDQAPAVDVDPAPADETTLAAVVDGLEGVDDEPALEGRVELERIDRGNGTTAVYVQDTATGVIERVVVRNDELEDDAL
jgi:hypothetical protein